MVKEEVIKYYTETKITVGGGFYEKAEEYTIQEYTKKKLQEIIEEGTISVKSDDRYNSTKTYTFSDYISKHCVTSEVNIYMDKQLKNVQQKVDKNVKEVFNTKVQAIMSEVALGVLKSNATYQDAMKKLTGN